MKDEIKANKRVVFYQDENQQIIIGFIDAYEFDDYIWLDIYKYQEGKPGLTKINKYTFGNIEGKVSKDAMDEWINKCAKEYFDDAYTQED